MKQLFSDIKVTYQVARTAWRSLRKHGKDLAGFSVQPLLLSDLPKLLEAAASGFGQAMKKDRENDPTLN